MAMNSNIRLDTQEQLMEDAKAKAKARYDRKLLDDQEEQIRNLLLMTGMQDPRNSRVEMKPRKEYTHFEDGLPAAEDLMALMDNPEAVKALAEQYRNKDNNRIVNDKKLDAIKDDFVPPMAKDSPSKEERAANDMKDYVPGEAGYGRKLFAELTMKDYKPSETPDAATEAGNAGAAAAPIKDKPINPSGVIAYQSDNQFVPVPEFHGGENPRKDQTIDKYKADVFSKPEEVKGNSNYFMPILGEPKVDEALKAIADKDPELLQLPEVQKLVKEREFWRNKGMDLFTFAPLATDPNASTQAAMGLIDKGDKNLMDAANNLETLRARQLDATKATADNLVAQKQITANMHNGVLNTEAALAQVAIPAQQQAYELRLQAGQVHDAGDEAINSAITNMQNFVQRLGDMGASAKDVAALNKAAAGLNASNINEFIETVRGIKVNKAMRRELNERLNAISADAAKYATAMITEKKLRKQADFHDARANSLLTAASKLGGQYRIPEWMTTELSTPFSDEENNVPDEKAKTDTKTPKDNAQNTQNTQTVPKGNASSTPVVQNSEPANSGTVVDPWYSSSSIQKLSSGELDKLFNALYNADIGKAVKGAKVDVYQTEQGAEGNAVGARKELAVAEVAQNTDRFVNTLDALANSNPKGLSKKLNALKNVDALNYFKNKVREGTALRQLLDNATNSDIRGKKTSYNFGDQESQIASLLMELGYV
jgi:hypothetical protein